MTGLVLSPDAGGKPVDESSFWGRIVHSWIDMRRATRGLIDENLGEHRLLFYVLLSDIVFFLSWSLKTVVSPISGVQANVPVEIGVWLIGALMLRTASMYVFSMALYLGARACGGKGTWKDTRCGLFWGALVAAPFGLLMAVVTVLISWLNPYFPILREEWVALPPYWLSLVPFIWFISQGLAEAHGFVRNSIPFMVMSVLALIALIGAMYLGAAGVH